MNSNQNQFGYMRLTKLAAESTALNNCREDLSDVNFEIGKNSYSLKVFAAIVAFAVIFGVRIIPRRMIGNPDYTII